MVEVFEKITLSNFWKINTKATIVLKMWTYFDLKTGWLKITVERNLKPQIYMYLSALTSSCDHKVMSSALVMNSERRMILYKQYLVTGEVHPQCTIKKGYLIQQIVC